MKHPSVGFRWGGWRERSRRRLAYPVEVGIGRPEVGETGGLQVAGHHLQGDVVADVLGGDEGDRRVVAPHPPHVVAGHPAEDDLIVVGDHDRDPALQQFEDDVRRAVAMRVDAAAEVGDVAVGDDRHVDTAGERRLDGGDEGGRLWRPDRHPHRRRGALDHVDRPAQQVVAADEVLDHARVERCVRRRAAPSPSDSIELAGLAAQPADQGVGGQGDVGDTLPLVAATSNTAPRATSLPSVSYTVLRGTPDTLATS